MVTQQRQGVSKRVALVLIVLVGLGVLDILVMGHKHTKTVTRTTTRVVTYDPTTQGGQAGLIAADQKYMQAQDALSRNHSIPTWTLGYIVSSVNPHQGQVINWVLSVVQGQSSWSAVTAKFAWSGHRWTPGGITLIQPLGNSPHDYDKFQPFAA
jgi:hypothetical protein